MDEQTAGSPPAPTVPLPQKLTAKKRAFLAAYAETCSISRAADAAKIRRETHYAWLGQGGEYALQFANAKAQAAERLEDEAVRRAHEGVERPMSIAGERELVREYSDTLLIFLLKGMKPEKYRERFSGELAAPGGGELFGSLAEAIRASRLQRQAAEQS